MRQLPLFKPDNLIVKKDTGRLFLVRKVTGDIYECISYPRSDVEEVCDITYFLEKDEVEFVNKAS